MVQIHRAIDRGVDSTDIELPSQGAAFCSPGILRPVNSETLNCTMSRTKPKGTSNDTVEVQTDPISDRLSNLTPVSVKLISGSESEPLWDHLVRSHHSLG